MLHSEFPGITEHDREQLELILSTWRFWARRPPTFIGPLGNGLTNCSYLVEDLDRRYVLRINFELSRSLDLHRSLEARVLRSASNAGIAPQLIYSDPHERYLVTEFISGRQWGGDELKTQDGITLLAKLLRRIHRLEKVPMFLDVEERAGYYWKHVDQRSELAAAIKKLQPDIQHHWRAAKNGMTQPCLCHNDLLPENIINHAGQLYAIDWEYAAMGDSYFDLAGVVEGHGLNETQSYQLLETYHGTTVSKVELKRLFHARILYNFLALLWYGVRYSPEQLDGMGALINEKLSVINELISIGDQ